MRRALRRTAVLAALAVAGACGGTEPTGGTLHLTLSGPAPARAIQFRLVGRLNGMVSTGSGRFFVDTLGVDTVMVIADAGPGGSLVGAILPQLEVPDVRAAYQALLLQVAAPDYSLQVPALYSLTVTATP